MKLNNKFTFTHNQCLQAQYTFIHDALEELITCGDTSFNVQSMRVKVNRMGKVNPETELTGFQEQFQVCMCMWLSKLDGCNIELFSY